MPTAMHLQGSWMDFRHQNPWDGEYWNDTTRRFTSEQWQGKVGEMAELGLQYIVLMSSALDDKAFYPSAHMPRWDLDCEDPIHAVLTAAEKHDIRVFVSAGFYGHTTEETSDADDYFAWHQQLVQELYARYNSYAAFYGWYVPNEGCIEGHYSKGFMDFLLQFAPYLKSIAGDKPVLIAPYGTNQVIEDEAFVDQLCALGRSGVDFIAYQDEVGVRKTKVEELDAIYARLRRLHFQAGKKCAQAPALWADTEIFEFEGGTYASPLIPASIDRIRGQLAAIAPYVGVMLCYQTHGLMNPPNSPQHCGHIDSIRLWNEYQNWRKS